MMDMEYVKAIFGRNAFLMSDGRKSIIKSFTKVRLAITSCKLNLISSNMN